MSLILPTQCVYVPIVFDRNKKSLWDDNSSHVFQDGMNCLERTNHAYLSHLVQGNLDKWLRLYPYFLVTKV